MGVYYTHCLIPKQNTIRPTPDQLVALIGAWVDKAFIVGPEGLPAWARTGSNQSMADTGACFRTEPPLPGSQIKQEPPHPEPPKSFWSGLFGSPQPKRQPVDLRTPFSIPPVGAALTALSQPDALIQWAPNPNAAYPMDTVAAFPAEPHNISIELADDFLNPRTDPYGNIGEDAKQLDGICPCGHNLEYDGAIHWRDTRRIRRVCPACGQSFRPQDHFAEIVDGATGAKIPCPGGHCRRFAINIDFGKDLPVHGRGADGELIDAKPRTSELFLKTCETALGFELVGFNDYG